MTWDGTDCAELDVASMRDRTAALFQDFIHYQLSAHDNIALGRASRWDDHEGVLQAAGAAGADPFLGGLPDGYATILSRAFAAGQDLSIGQWQRVALARAIFRHADFVMLDEPTASLDARAEYQLFQRMRELFRGQAVLLISHRFSSVRSADRIYVLDHGRVAEHGTHDELVAAGRLYAELFALQAGAYS